MKKASKSRPLILDGESLTLSDLPQIAAGSPLLLSPKVKKKIEGSARFVREAANSPLPAYGINTGFGFFANKKIPVKDLEVLQVNLLKSHAAGYGTPLSEEETRLAMALRLNVLVKGYTGVSYALCEALLRLIEAGICPVIPEMGSVGASGDLAPLAHLALPLIGEGYVTYKGETLSSADALRKAGLKPYKLKAKEGLGLINGTQIMLAVGALALASGVVFVRKANKVAALTYEALQGHTAALSPEIQRVRPHPGQASVAQSIIKELEGSYLFNEKTVRRRLQDPYSLRCVPQVHGASQELLEFASRIVETELNAATDNPLIFASERKILSGGNFHGQPLAFAFDIAAMAIAELCNISERRLEQLLNPMLSGLSAFLTPHEGLNSGYMAAQYLSASVVNENKLLANPSSTDSIPGNAGVEDHVSMGMTSARKLRRVVQNSKAVFAAEWLAAAQAVDLRGPVQLGKGTKAIYQVLRSKVPYLGSDRIIAEDIAKAVSALDYL